MIITKDFVFVHWNKTGGSFVAESLRELLSPTVARRLIYKLDKKLGIRLPLYDYRYRELIFPGKRQHAWCVDIPAYAQGKPIISIVRNPFDTYLSHYKFGWWKRELSGRTPKHVDTFFEEPDTFRGRYSGFESWDLSQFLQSVWESSTWVRRAMAANERTNLGMLSASFVFFFCRDPDFVLKAACDEEELVRRVRETLFPIHFLQQERLNEDLFNYLVSVGYDPHRVQFIRSRARENVSQQGRSQRAAWDPALRLEVLRKEAMLFRLFPFYHPEREG